MRLESTGHDDTSVRFKYTDRQTGQETNLSFRLQYYDPATGYQEYDGSETTASGAYVFNPKPNNA